MAYCALRARSCHPLADATLLDSLASPLSTPRSPPSSPAISLPTPSYPCFYATPSSPTPFPLLSCPSAHKLHRKWSTEQSTECPYIFSVKKTKNLSVYLGYLFLTRNGLYFFRAFFSHQCPPPARSLHTPFPPLPLFICYPFFLHILPPLLSSLAPASTTALSPCPHLPDSQRSYCQQLQNSEPSRQVSTQAPASCAPAPGPALAQPWPSSPRGRLGSASNKRACFT